MEQSSSTNLKFLHPLKQRAFEFLKENPHKTFVDFQVLTGDISVTEQHFNEVQHAIKAKESLELPPVPNRGFGLFDLSGSSVKRNSIPRIRKDDNRESPREISEKRQRNSRVKRFIVENPAGSYDELVNETGIHEISKPYFHTMKSIMRSKGEIPDTTTRRSRRMIEFDEAHSEPATYGAIGSITGKRYNDELRREILDYVVSHNQEFERGGTSAAMKKYGVSFVTLSKWLKEAGISTPRRGGRRKSADSVYKPKAPLVPGARRRGRPPKSERRDISSVAQVDQRSLRKLVVRISRMQEDLRDLESELQSLLQA